MKKVLALVGLTLLMAVPASAQVDPDLNGLGIYFDLNTFEQRCSPTGPAPMTMLYVYLVASNIRPDLTMGGWECSVYHDVPGLSYLSTTVHGQGPINIMTPPDFMVGLGMWMDWAPYHHLATLQYFVMSNVPATWRVGPLRGTFQSIPGEACYADGIDPGILVPFQPPQGSWDLPAAKLYQVCDIVAVEDETWGGVKGMFK